mmetsp:Transcript_60384/g.141337  ORF Transcript_60384/g.141337 Transcript_60384/m.141337 type:complete len:210 (+) Transcript_60384:2234-2863(+)
MSWDRLLMKRSSAFSWVLGFPSWPLRIFSTFSHNQPHATSWSLSHSLGASDRRVASITERYSFRRIVPSYFERTKVRTSHSSLKRYEFATFITMASNCSRIRFIQLLVPKPMTAALNKNMSLKVFGTFTSFPAALPPRSDSSSMSLCRCSFGESSSSLTSSTLLLFSTSSVSRSSISPSSKSSAALDVAVRQLLWIIRTREAYSRLTKQ